MTEEGAQLTVMTTIIIKLARQVPLNEFDKDYLSGILEEFDEASEEDQEKLMVFTDMLQAEIDKRKGRIN